MVELTDELEELRIDMDRINFRLTDALFIHGEFSPEVASLIREREDKARQIGEYKMLHCLPICDLQREAQMYSNIKDYADGNGYDVERAVKFFRRLVGKSKRLQEGVIAHASR